MTIYKFVLTQEFWRVTFVETILYEHLYYGENCLFGGKKKEKPNR